MSTFSHEDTNVRPSVYDADSVDQTIQLNKVSWGAIFAGVVVALVVQALLAMLGLGIGIATLDPGTSDNPDGTTFSIVAGIWYVVAGIIAAFAGGYISARMSGKIVPTTGALHGLTTWALTTLLVIYLLTSSVGSLVGGVFSGVASALGGTGQTIAQTAAPMLANSNPLEALESQVRATGTDSDALNAAAMNAMRSLVMGDAASADAARKQAAEALATARGIPLDQATQQVTNMEKQYHDTVESAKQQAIEAAQAAASVASTSAILAFVALVLGALAGWFGGRSGVVHPIYADRILPSRRTTLRDRE
ncbi:MULTISPECIES: PhnA-like protein [Mesorhizobium]|uniref:PhnA-like protein n=1 Tax=Mesorhizobium temperatum TaxID=241416 RepID=A0A271LP15_9HYPH|nr:MULTISPECIES: PhnA-like protein [Mesorhizobium]PAQ09814.1 PhnA-like protein [Mesorhizobium temperatum]